MGKDEDTNVLPVLDACSAHFGYTQDKPPYIIGCYGPNNDGSMVTVEQCRSFYTGCDGELTTYTTTDGTEQYDLWCPCYDANGANTGVDIAPLAFEANSSSTGVYGCANTDLAATFAVFNAFLAITAILSLS